MANISESEAHDETGVHAKTSNMLMADGDVKQVKQMLNASSAEMDSTDTGWRRKAWVLMEEPTSHWLALHIHYAYSALIIVSVGSTVAQTLENLSDEAQLLLDIFEGFCTVTFTLEVILRTICAPNRKLLAQNFYMWMDVSAVIPAYLVWILGEENMSNMYLELLLLLVPIMRLLKITRHSSGWRILVISLKECAEPLGVPAFLLMLMTVLASCVIYWLEKNFSCTGPNCAEEDMKAFSSIPHTMWFTIVTISTVGYGDVSPNTIAGKFASSLLILAGVCYMAMPLAIMGGTFCRIWDDRDRLLMREKTRTKLAQFGVTVQDLKCIFDAADSDGSGTVTRSEFIDLVEAFQLGMTRPQIIRLFKSVDEDGSGQINFDEFVAFLFPELIALTEKENEEAEKCKEAEKTDSKKTPLVSVDDKRFDRLGEFQIRLDSLEQAVLTICKDQEKRHAEARRLLRTAVDAVHTHPTQPGAIVN